MDVEIVEFQLPWAMILSYALMAMIAICSLYFFYLKDGFIEIKKYASRGDYFLITTHAVLIYIATTSIVNVLLEHYESVKRVNEQSFSSIEGRLVSVVSAHYFRKGLLEIENKYGSIESVVLPERNRTGSPGCINDSYSSLPEMVGDIITVNYFNKKSHNCILSISVTQY